MTRTEVSLEASSARQMKAMMRLLRVIPLLTAAVMAPCAFPSYVYAAPTNETAEVASAGDLAQENIDAYARELLSTEETDASLSAEESAAGYQIVDGHKYSPEALEGDSSDGDVVYGGVEGSAVTGTVTFIVNVPEYIHEEVYVNVTNLNTYVIYGVKLYEANGYSSQIHVPSGNYLVTAGGLMSDNERRFYLSSLQFTVKRGSIQTAVVALNDNHPELAEGYQPDETWKGNEQPSQDGGPESLPEATSGTEDPTQAAQETASQSEGPSQETPSTWYLTLVSLLIPITIIIVAVIIGSRFRKKKRGFY